jgi:hypothetical protein
MKTGKEKRRLTRLNAGGDLQAALDALRAGDVLELEAGATWEGEYKLRENTGGQITIRSSAAESLKPGTRVKAEFGGFGRIVGYVLADPNANGYRLQGLELTPWAGIYTGRLLALGEYGMTLNELPGDISVEHCYIHADAELGGKRGIEANCRALSVRDSYISGFGSDFQDSQAICGWGGPGPFTIVNNYLEASGENVMFGGAAPWIPGLIPSDIVLEHNHLYKPLSWRNRFVVKNIFEVKNGRRIRARWNVFENCWTSGQAGFAIMLTVRTCEGGNYDWARVEDIEISDNVIIAENGVTVSGRDNLRDNCGGGGPAGYAGNIRIKRNLFPSIDWRTFAIFNAPDTVIEHNTFPRSSGAVLVSEGDPQAGFVFRNNLGQFGTGIMGTDTQQGTATLQRFFPGCDFSGNVLTGLSAGDAWVNQPQYADWYPHGDNTYLMAGETAAAAGAGCDLAALDAAIANVRSGETRVPVPPAEEDRNPKPATITLVLSKALPPGTYTLDVKAA